MDIIKRTLLKFSNGELVLFLGRSSIDFAELMLGQAVTHEQIVDSLYFSLGIGLIQNCDFREKLIERMSKQDVDDVLSTISSIYSSDTKISSLPTTISKYEFLIEFSKIDIDSFAMALGLADEWEESKNSSVKVKGIQKISAKYPMYPYQSEIVGRVLNLINDNINSRCLIHLPTGSGKTRTAMNVASMHLRMNPSGLVVWLADTQELCSQAALEFNKAWSFLGDRDVKNYSYYSDTDISLGGVEKGFLVAGLQKLNSIRKSESKLLFDLVAKNASLVIFDEAHKAIASTYSDISTELSRNISNKSFLLGLTATPGRSYMQGDSPEDRSLSDFFNNKKISMSVAGYLSPIDYLISNKYLARPEFISVDYANTIKLSFNQNSNDDILGSLSDIDSRNKKILSVVKDEAALGSKIIVFACSVKHARELASCLCFMGIRATSLDSKYDNDFTRRSKISSYLKGDLQVLINFNILTAGFDAPKTNVALIARPTNSLVQYSQMVGRAMRGEKSEGNEMCRIYTVADDIDEFRNVAAAFEHWDKLWTDLD